MTNKKIDENEKIDLELIQSAFVRTIEKDLQQMVLLLEIIEEQRALIENLIDAEPIAGTKQESFIRENLKRTKSKIKHAKILITGETYDQQKNP